MAEYNPSKIIKDGNTYNFRDDTKIPLAGSNQISGSLIPATTDAYDLGGSSYQWNNAYIKSLTINGTAAGDILTHNVSEFVNVTSAQTIGGIKTFSSSPRVTKTSPDIALNISDCDVTEIPTETKTASLLFRDKNNKNLAYIVGQQRFDGKKRMCIRAHRTDNINNYYSVDLDSDGDFYPEQNNGMNLGTSALKWKSVYTNAINGINPGALSLPSTAIGFVDIKSTVGQYLKDNNTNIYEFTAPFDGWVCVGVVKGSLRIDNITTSISSGSETLGWWRSYTIPFMKNNSIEIKINKTDPADDYVNDIMWKAYIYPCQGNV